MAFKMKGWAAFKQNDDEENIAYGVKKSDSISQNKHNEAVNQEMLDFKKAYHDKHGSSSGGTDDEFKAYQDSLNVIRRKYIKDK